MQNIETKWGFNQVRIGDLIVYTCKIAIGETAKFPEIDGVCVNLSYKYNDFLQGYIPSKKMIRYTTTNHEEHLRMQREVMLGLENHAMNKVKLKYQWLHTQNN